MITFNSFIPLWLVFTLVIPLLGYFLWIEWRRKLRFQTLRFIAVMVMMTMLAGILLRPGYVAEKSSLILLLTPGYNKMKVDSLLKMNPDLILMHTPGVVPYKRSTELVPYYDLANIGSNISFILGEGLPTDALDLIKNKHFYFIPAPSPEGITELSLPQRILAHHNHVIEGVYHNTSGKKRIYLNDPEGKKDSAMINGRGMKSFSLSFSPRQSGNFLYNLTIQDSEGNVVRENVPLSIREASNLDILFIQGYPTFETQYLKSFLSHKNHKLVLRYQLSQNNFRFEYANRKTMQIDRLTKTTLDNFDLLIIDGRSIQKLSEVEKNNIKESIQSGLGILILPNIPLKDYAKLKDLFPFEMVSVKTDTAVFMNESKAVTLPAIPARAKNNAPLQTLIKNKNGILSGYTFDGAGKIGFQFLQETFQLALSGDSLTYTSVWSPLIEQISRPQSNEPAIRIVQNFPWHTDDPLAVEVISSDEKPVLFADSVRIPLREDVLLDDVWHTRIWADTPGWHILQANDTVLPFYVSKKDEWKTLSLGVQMAENLNSIKSDDQSPGEKIREPREVSPIYFFIFFVLAAGFIWLAPKL